MKNEIVQSIKGWKNLYRKPEKYNVISKWFDSTEIEIKIFLQLVNFKDKIVLDVGAGTGRLAIPLSKIAQKIYAIEPQEEMLKYMKSKIKEIEIKNIEVKKASAENIPYSNNLFDIVLCTWVVAHFKDFERSFYEMKRVLKKSGILLIVEHNGEDDWEKLAVIENPSDAGKYKKRYNKVKKQLEDFQDIKIKVVDSYIKFPDLETATAVIKELKGSKASKYIKENRMLKILNKILIIYAKK